jgi:hypothetical protein
MIVKFKVEIDNRGRSLGWGYKDRQNGVYILTVDKPEGLEITIANAYQLFWRSVKNYHQWQKLHNENWYSEKKYDKEKLAKIKVLNIEPEEIKNEKLFKIGKY